MRPRNLEIKGLQSFKDMQRIDFDALGETGLFGIFGPTGSGKSTVLDAITLALYGNVQRAGRGTQGIINTDMDEVEVSFTFDLLKEGTRKTYRVDRVYRRRKGSDVSVENRLARLCETAGGRDVVIADKLGDVNRKVEELIGLSPGDFTRSVVLPQNKFQEFLLLDGAERRKMLERIFYLEEYGQQLAEKLTARLNGVEMQLEKLKGAISSLGDASGEALKDAEDRLKEAAALKDKTEKELQLTEKKYIDAKEVWTLQDEMEAVVREEDTLLSRRPEVERNRRLYQQALKAKELEGAIGKYNELRASLADTIVQLQEASDRLSRLEEEKKRVTELYDLKKQEVEKERPALIEQKSRLKDALEIESEIEGIDKKLKGLRGHYNDIERMVKEKDLQIKATKNRLAGIEKSVQDLKLNAETLKVAPEYRRQISMGVRLEEELERLEEELREQIKKRSKTEAGIEVLETELKKAGAAKQEAQKRLEAEKARQAEMESRQPCRRDDLRKDIENFHKLQLDFQALQAATAISDSLAQKLRDLDLLAEKKEKELADRKAQRDAMLMELDSERRELEALRLKYEKNTVFLLAKELKENQACPVCGSTHHPRPAAQPEGEETRDIERRFEEHKRMVETAQDQYRDVESSCLVLEEQLNGIHSQRLQTSRELETAEKKYRTLAAGLPGSMREFDIRRLEQELAGMEAQYTMKLNALEEWEADYTRLGENVLALSQEYSDITVKYNSKKAELEVNSQGLDSLARAIEELSGELEGKREERSKLLSRLGIGSARREMETIEEKDRRAQSLQGELEQLQLRGKEQRDALENLIGERHRLDSRLSVVETEGRGLKERRDKESSRLAALTEGRDVRTAVQAVDDRLKGLEQQERDLQERVKALEARHNELCSRKSSLENQQRIYEQSLDIDGKRLMEDIKNRGFDSIEQAVGFLLPEEDLEALADVIQRYDEQYKEVKAQKRVCEKKLKGRSLSEEDWCRINEEYSLKKQQREESILLYQEARVNCNRLRDNHAKWRDLNKQYRKLERKQDMLVQIQKLLRGNSFVDYISEERLRYIAREASEVLSVLTKYRYALELDTDQGFVIRDNANGGVCRAVSTLSGGETFLTSLSLALALSKQVQLKGQSPLEFFFLDEGFGTLDNGLLDVVIDALEKLSSKERVIGVISHVPELRNRIARRLIIEPPSAGGEGSNASMERA